MQTSSHYPACPAPVHVRLTVLPEHSCPYLPGRRASTRAFLAQRMSGRVYHAFMDAGFRRSGSMVYQPVCRGCRECLPIRVPVNRFMPSRSQRRCARRNADVRIQLGPPEPTDEKFRLYQRYMTAWHGAAAESRADFVSFLYDSPVETVEFTYRDAVGALLAVGLCDVCTQSLSSVYAYFDPAEAQRGLGTFSALAEIEHARRMGIAYYYLGYWIAGCARMNYKSGFRPNEVLDTDGVWREIPRPACEAAVPTAAENGSRRLC